MKNKNDIPWELIVSRFKHILSDEDEKVLDVWLQNEGNRVLYKDLKELWDNIQLEALDYDPDIQYYEKKLIDRIHSNAHPQIIKKQKIKVISYTIAACVIILVSILTFNHFVDWSSITDKSPSVQTIVSLGGKTKVLLADSTIVWLHKNSSLTYDRNFLEENRKVKISGEAFFEVSHSKYPFIVDVNDEFSIKVHGTKFNVKSSENSLDVEVSLVEGLVEMNTSHQNLFLHPGLKGRFDGDEKLISFEKADIELEISWAREFLFFNQASLKEISLYLAKWYNIEIVLDPGIALYAYTFTLRSESIDEVLRLMSRIHPIQYSFSENNVLIIKE